MTTELESQEVHTAVPVIPTTDAPIKFDVSASAIARMEKEADKLSIAGPNDKDGHKAVYSYRQMVKDQRIEVEKRQAALKRPHIDYNRDVDAMAKSLIEPMKAIENKLSIQEKEYNDERARLAEERERAIRKRADDRVHLLKACGFTYNVMNDAWEFGNPDEANYVAVNFDDIKGLSDEDYQPTADLVKATYEAEQQRIAEEKLRAEQEAQRVDERLKQLRAWGFVWNTQSEMYEFVDGLGASQYEVFPENIRDASDEEFAPIAGTAKRVYEAEQDRRAEVKRLAAELEEKNRQEAERLQAIADQQAADQKAIDDARKQLEEDRKTMILSNRGPQLLAVGFDWNGSRYKLLDVFRLGIVDVVDMTDEQFADLLTDAKAKVTEAAEEADRIAKAQKKADADKKAADKARIARLKPDKKVILKHLDTVLEVAAPAVNEPEASDFLNRFKGALALLVDSYCKELDAL